MPKELVLLLELVIDKINPDSEYRFAECSCEFKDIRVSPCLSMSGSTPASKNIKK